MISLQTDPDAWDKVGSKSKHKINVWVTLVHLIVRYNIFFHTKHCCKNCSKFSSFYLSIALDFLPCLLALRDVYENVNGTQAIL